MVAADTVVVFAPIAAALAAVSVGALIKVTRVFLAHIERKDQEFTTFLGNHMSGNTRALQSLTSATEKLADRFEDHDERTRGGS